MVTFFTTEANISLNLEKLVTINMSLIVSVIINLARIGATAGIFMFHVFALLGINNEGMFFVPLLIFCFLSGYLSYSAKNIPLKWLYRRAFSIMLPYWFVIIPVVILNHIVSYKETTLFMDIITLLGGNLFLKNPVYVIAWYVTFIMLLYILMFIQSLSKNIIIKGIIWIVGIIIFGGFLHTLYYFISFSGGVIFSKIVLPPKKEVSMQDSVSRILYVLQDKCYAFFLVHGGVLILLFYKFKVTGIGLVCWGILMSSLAAVILRKITKPLIPKAVDKMLQLTSGLTCFP